MLASRVRVPAPRSRALAVVLLRGMWTLPTNLLGHLICLLLSGRRGHKVGSGVGTGWVYPVRPGIGLDWMGAVTLGNAILYRQGMFDGLRGQLVLAHELAHTRQHDLLGPLYLPLHVICQAVSLLISLLSPGPVRHSRVHDHNPLEQTFISLAAGATDSWPAAAQRDGITVARMLEAYGLLAPSAPRIPVCSKVPSRAPRA